MTFRRFASPLSVLVLVASAAACGAPDPEDDRGEDLDESGDAIKGGYLDDADTAVVGIADANAGGLCTGTLIAQNVVLTARHCVSSVQNEVDGGVKCNETTFGPLRPAKNFYVTTREKLTKYENDYHRVREVVGLPTTDKELCGADQAILILDDLVAPEEAVPIVPRVDAPLVPGEEYFAVGFGATNDAGSGAGVRRRRDGLFVDCVADDCPGYYVKPTEWVGDQGICQGDSGGPALDLMHRVVGVTSRGAYGCEDPVYGYVLGWAQWIKDTTIYAAGLGGYPPPAWATGWPTDPAYSQPIGGACTQPADCPSGKCMNDGQASYCTRLCNDLAPCPEGWTCDPSILVCVQVHPPPDEQLPPGEGPAADGGDNAADDALEESSCSVRRTGDDPTKPIPWRFGAAGLVAALAWVRRRTRR